MTDTTARVIATLVVLTPIATAVVLIECGYVGWGWSVLALVVIAAIGACMWDVHLRRVSEGRRR